jgi:glycolate oxidase iron-sulfur subunit
VLQTGEKVFSCNRCGLCQEVCPTYKATGVELAVARGRNSLLRVLAESSRGRRDPAFDGMDYLDTCLLCGACAEICPAEIPTHELIPAARAEAANRRRLPELRTLLLRLIMVQPSRLAIPLRLLRFYQVSGARRLLRASRVLDLLGDLGRIEAIQPPVPRRSLRWRLKMVRGAGRRPPPAGPASTDREARRLPGRGRRVAYFLGCLTDNLYPDLGQAVIRVLELSGYEVVVPSNQCCGLAHEAYGDLATAERLARRNLDLLGALDPDFVVTDCATCAHALARYPKLVHDDKTYGPEALTLGAKLRDVCQLLAEEGFQAGSQSQTVRATYHDPCHLARGLGLRSEPRQVLRGLPGVDYVELPEADWCCGGAGIFNLTHHRLSADVLDRKLVNIKATASDVVATSCPSCRIQLSYGLQQAGLRPRVVHPVELLDWTYGAEGSESADEGGLDS